MVEIGRESMRATKVSEGENSHAKNYSHGGRASEWSAQPERYIERSVHKGKITHSRYFGRRAIKIKVRTKG